MTTTVKHTPGPWHVDPRPQYRELIRDPDDVLVASTSGCGYVKHTAANAALIAAAPELLACLKAYAKQYDPDGTDEVTQKVIAQAEGR